MRPADPSPRRAGTLLLALACGACFSPSGGDTAATTDAGTTPGTGTSAGPGTATTAVDPSTSTTNPTSSTSGAVTTGTTTTASTTATTATTADATTGTATGTATTAGEPMCGNRILESGEDCDDGNIVDGDGCSASCESEAAGARFIFLTSVKFSGEDVGTLEGAGERCKTLADSAEALSELHNRAWVAWLSDLDDDARDRIGDFSGDYILPDEHVIVAKGSAGLVSGALLAPIRENEKGVAEASMVPCDQSPDDPVWTGTNSDGTRAEAHCTGWSTTNGEGLMGAYPATGPTWTQCVVAMCTVSARLYCVEI